MVVIYAASKRSYLVPAAAANLQTNESSPAPTSQAQQPSALVARKHWFEHLVLDCLRRHAPPEEFLSVLRSTHRELLVQNAQIQLSPAAPAVSATPATAISTTVMGTDVEENKEEPMEVDEKVIAVTPQVNNAGHSEEKKGEQEDVEMLKKAEKNNNQNGNGAVVAPVPTSWGTEEIIQNGRLGDGGAGHRYVDLQKFLTKKASSLVRIGAHLYSPPSNSSPRIQQLPYAYLDALLYTGDYISRATYVSALCAFDNFSPTAELDTGEQRLNQTSSLPNPSLLIVSSLVERLVRVANEISPSSWRDADECLELGGVLFEALGWMVRGVEAILSSRLLTPLPTASVESTTPAAAGGTEPPAELVALVEALYRGVETLHASLFVRVCIYAHVRRLEGEVKEERRETAEPLELFNFYSTSSVLNQRKDEQGIGNVGKKRRRIVEITGAIREKLGANEAKIENEGLSPLLPIVERLHSALLPDFFRPPSATAFHWQPATREDYIRRELRPTLLTLAGIFATLRPLKSAAEQAHALRIFSEVMGLGRSERLVFDVLRSGFLIQLDAAAMGQHSQGGAEGPAGVETLADMWTYLKLPLILRKLVEKEGVNKAEVLSALTRLSRQHTLLNEVDIRKWDNSLLHIACELREYGILTVDEVQKLIDSRLEGVEQSAPELYKMLEASATASLQQQKGGKMVDASNAKITSTPSTGSSPLPTAEQADKASDGTSLDGGVSKPDAAATSGRTTTAVVDNKQSQVALLKAAQNAKKAFERSLTSDNKKWIPMVSRLLKSVANVDALCSVFCAEGNLHQFSAKLAAINCQTEKAPGSPSLIDPDEGKNRMLMFDSTFLLLSRILYTYLDMRLDELVGGSVEPQAQASFYRWSRNYQLHLNSGLPMPSRASTIATGTSEQQSQAAGGEAAAAEAADEHQVAREQFITEYLPLLQAGRPYWNESWDFGKLLDNTPLVGEWMLEQCAHLHHTSKDGGTTGVATSIGPNSSSGVGGSGEPKTPTTSTPSTTLSIATASTTTVAAAASSNAGSGNADAISGGLASCSTSAVAPPTITSTLYEVLNALREMSCLLLALIQWLEVQSPAPPLVEGGAAAENSAALQARRTLARTIIAWGAQQQLPPTQQPVASAAATTTAPPPVGGGVANSDSQQPPPPQHHQELIAHRVQFTLAMARGALWEMAEGDGGAACRRQQQQQQVIYTWVISFARQSMLPPVNYHSVVPDMQALKEAFLYAMKTGWAGPSVLAYVARCNRALQYGWCLCWLKQMLKICTADEMEMAGELCIATALTQPVKCLLELIHPLVDCIFFVEQQQPHHGSGGGGGGGGGGGNNSMSGQWSQQQPHHSSTSSSSNTAAATTSHQRHHPQQQSQHPYANIAINKTSATVVARTLVRLLTLLLWAEDCRREQERQKAERRLAAMSVLRNRNHHHHHLHQQQRSKTPLPTMAAFQQQQQPQQPTATAQSVEGEANSSVSTTSGGVAAEDRNTSIAMEVEEGKSVIEQQQQQSQKQMEVDDPTSSDEPSSAASSSSSMVQQPSTSVPAMGPSSAPPSVMNNGEQSPPSPSSSSASASVAANPRRPHTPATISTSTTTNPTLGQSTPATDPSGSGGAAAPANSRNNSSIAKPHRAAAAAAAAVVVEKAIAYVFERFQRALVGANLRPSVTFIVFFMQELCNAPATSYRQRLINMIPMQLFFSLARVDPTAVPLAAFLSLHDNTHAEAQEGGGGSNSSNRNDHDVEKRMAALRYACMMRRFGQA